MRYLVITPSSTNCSALQRCVEATLEAATLCNGGCNPVRWRLQPHAAEAATPCDRGCSPMCCRCVEATLALQSELRLEIEAAAIEAAYSTRGVRVS